MHVSHWIYRGVGWFALANLIAVICRQTIGANDLMMEACAVLGVLVLYVLAWGQLQIAYYLYAVNRLLWKVVGVKKSYKLSVDWNTDAIVSYVDDRYYIELVANDSLDVVVLVIASKMVTATKKTPAGVLVPIRGEKSSDLNKMTFDEHVYMPDYRKELRRLRWALKIQLPLRGRFTP